MSNIEDFANQLHQDVVSDIAESYFGARKNLEDMINAFEVMAEELRSIAGNLSKAAATLHKLLLDSTTTCDFYTYLNIEPCCIPFSCEAASTLDLGPVPFAFTCRGRYTKSVIRAYDHFQKASDEYLNGRYFDDPDRPGRKRLTVHYLRLKALSEYINGEVVRVNEQISATGMLRYVKEMDPDKMEREKIMGDVCLLEGGGLDKDMCFTPLDFDSLELPVVQDMPSVREAQDAIRMFCKKLYSTNKHEVERIVDDLRKAASRSH